MIMFNLVLILLLTSIKWCTEGLSIGNCASNEFQCKSSYECIPEIAYCDGEQDCIDGSDEDGCIGNCFSSQFQCKYDELSDESIRCIPKEFRCDGVKDCPDGSDEVECNNTVSCTGFICGNYDCIPSSQLCDGNMDCTDGSDEQLCFLNDSHKNEACSQNFDNTPRGPRCYCNDGYALDTNDNKTCNDVDECLQEGFCSHDCINTEGSYKCSCQDGYELVNRTCRATGDDPILIYSTLKEVRGIRLRSNQFFLFTTSLLSRITAVDIDPKRKLMYWIDIENRSILKRKMDGSNFSSVLSHGFLVPEGIAVDYITNNLYITDSGLRQILACKADGDICHVLHSNLEKPRALALDLDRRLMYWSDWGEKLPGIYMSGMDGSSLILMVSNSISWPNGIALDHTTNRLYWGDAKLHTIEFITFDRTQRKTILNGTRLHPYFLTLFEDTIYWSDWSQFSLESCNKFTGERVTILGRQSGQKIMGVHVYHPVLTSKVSNPCLSNDCSHMCFMSPIKGFSCACPHGFVLSSDEKTCKMCDGFFCSATGQCLPWSRVCDGIENCHLVSDEGGLCSASCAGGKGNCSHRCQKTPEGSKCLCDKGYRLLPDNKTCSTINECQAFDACSHYCRNAKESYECTCADGYRLKNDNHSCVAEGEPATLMYLLKDAMRGLDLETYSSQFHLIVKGANMKGFDFDETEKVFFWTDLNEESIDSYSKNNNSHDVVYRSCSRPVAVRFDWLARNLYFLDEKSNIGVCTRNGKICKTLFKSGGRRIDSMTISPPSGYMFWTIWGSSFRYNLSGVIRRAEMNGSHVLNIVSSDVFSPTAITVDPVLEVVYWADMKLKTLECANFNGFQRKRIVESGVHHPVASVVFEDHVYWIDWGTNNIVRCHKFIKGRCGNVTEGNVKAHDLLVAHKVMQPKRNSSKCLVENGGCSHLCLTARIGKTCACSDHMTLDEDDRTCLARKCEENEFRCKDSLCIPDEFRCDGSKQCRDGSDEINCGSVDAVKASD